MMRAECMVGTSEPHWTAAVKCEDKDNHNDSGISPGRTSSDATTNSPQSPGTAGYMGIFQVRSPGRNTSSGSASPQSPTTGHFPRLSSRSPADISSSPHSPRNNMAFPGSPTQTNEPQESSLERLKMALERSTALSGIYSHVPEPEPEAQSDANTKKEYPCPLCAYTTPYRHRYMEHVGTHYADKCTLCDFTGSNGADLRIHLQEIHNISDLQDFVDPTDAASDGAGDEDTTGKRTKSKTFKCKQCPYETRTKLEFWDHTKTHIKAEKLLSCPKCPFVTEYKHHLEYHLRNHFGSKPYSCPKCTYSCVNKSMLNSHLKSHSNVYQYRCADCAYATKYCHSLKLHLRKYEHNPAMVLNADGSPNPLPIIDVYGTRRGPKQKNLKLDSSLELANQDSQSPKHNLPGGVVVPNAPLSSPVRANVNNNNVENSPQNGDRPKYFYCSLCDFYSLSPEILNQHMYLHAAESPMVQMFRTNNNLPDQSAIKEYFHNVFLNMTETPVSPVSLVSPNTSPLVRNTASPLDLSKPDAKHISIPNTENGKPNGDCKKNRRKGKAFKLERPTDVLEVNMETDDSFKIKIPDFKPKSVEVDTKVEEYNCNFCDITFKDVVMYTMHMGYHGYQDPFTCNMCGQVTPDKVAFFIHIARSSHS